VNLIVACRLTLGACVLIHISVRAQNWGVTCMRQFYILLWLQKVLSGLTYVRSRIASYGVQVPSRITFKWTSGRAAGSSHWSPLKRRAVTASQGLTSVLPKRNTETLHRTIWDCLACARLFTLHHVLKGVRSGAVGWGTALQTGRSRVRFSIVTGMFQWLNPSGRLSL
jgi:hypothetical protein